MADPVHALERWERRLQHGDRTPLTMACERALTASGFAWRIVVTRHTSGARHDGERVSALDMASVGLAPRGPLRAAQDVRIVAIDPTDPVFAALSERFVRGIQHDPSAAPLCVFALVDHLLASITAPDDVRARVLEPLARAVVRARPPHTNGPRGATEGT
jgi:hypothetical protein